MSVVMGSQAKALQFDPFTPGLSVSFRDPFGSGQINRDILPGDPNGIAKLDTAVAAAGIVDTSEYSSREGMNLPGHATASATLYRSGGTDYRSVTMARTAKDGQSSIVKTVAGERMAQTIDGMVGVSSDTIPASSHFGDSSLSLQLGGTHLAGFVANHPFLGCFTEPADCTPILISALVLHSLFGPESPLNVNGTYAYSFDSAGGSNCWNSIQTENPLLSLLMQNDGTSEAFHRIKDALEQEFGAVVARDGGFSFAAKVEDSGLESTGSRGDQVQTPLTIDFNFIFDRGNIHFIIKPKDAPAGSLYFPDQGPIGDVIRAIFAEAKFEPIQPGVEPQSNGANGNSMEE